MLPLKSLRLLAVAMTASSALLLPSSATLAANDGMEWQFSEFNDPDNKGRLTARLTFGVPETDNVQVTGVCDGSPSTSARFSSVTFGADTGSLKEGEQVDLRFSGGGFDHVMRGAVYGTQAEEGVSGVLLDIEHNGVFVDRKYLAKAGPELEAETKNHRAKIIAELGPGAKPTSNVTLIGPLQSKGIKFTKMTKTGGRYSLDSEVLE